MQSIIKLQFLCLWLLWGQVLGQDIEPEFPEDFPVSTIKPNTFTSTTAKATQEPETSTTERGITSTTEASTTELTTQETTRGTTIQPSAATSTSSWRPTYAPPTRPSKPFDTPAWRPTYPPPTRPFIPFPTGLPWYDNSLEDPTCYLKEQDSGYKFEWVCGVPTLTPLINCYRCCYYKFNGISGCNRLHSGNCEGLNLSWEFD